MKNVLRIAAIVLPLACSVTLAAAQTNPNFDLNTGSENSIREFLGEPQLKDDGSITRSEQNVDRGAYRRDRTYDR